MKSDFPNDLDTATHPAIRPGRAWMNGAIILANLLIFIIQWNNPGLMQQYMLAARSPDLADFVTYAFLHLGWLHLLVNLLVLHVLGPQVNRALGHVGYLAFYLGGAVFSGIGFILGGGLAVVGASGAAGAVMGAYLVLLPRSQIIVNLFFGYLQVPAMYFIVTFFAYNLIMSLTPATQQDVAYGAHVAGMLFGFVATALLVVVRLLPRSPHDLLAMAGQWLRSRRIGFRQSTS